MKPQYNKQHISLNIVWLILSIFISTITQAIVPQIERDALVALYNSTNGANWTNNTNWLVGDPCDNGWFGVVCELNTVIELNLGGNNLNGSENIGLPPEIGNLTSLKIIHFENNPFFSSIPLEIGDLTNLIELHLNHSLIEGSIPSEVGGLINLEKLILTGNRITGNIPSQIGNLINLKVLKINFNFQLNGIIPEEIGNLTNLIELHLNNNFELNGSIPSTIGNLMNLSILDISQTKLNGAIPIEIGNLVNLTYMNLFGNQLFGSIPIEIGNLLNLQQLDISRNRLTGEIPVSLMNLNGLINGRLSLKYNGLYTNNTTLDAFLDNKQLGGNWSLTQTVAPNDLTAINAVTNTISLTWDLIEYTQNAGRYRVWYSESPTGPYLDGGATNSKLENSFTLTGLTENTDYYIVVRTESDVSPVNQNMIISDDSNQVMATAQVVPVTTQERNALIALYNSTNGANWTNNSNWLVGDPCIDAWFGVSCTGNAVFIVNLRANNLVGTIPIDLGNLTNLVQLYLDNNQLTGTIPTELGNLVNLQNLGLWSNQITGTIPTQLSNLNNLQQLALSTNQLTGNVPSWLGSLSQLSSLSLYANQLSGVIPTSLGNLSNLRFLRLNDNQLNGTIPASLGNLSNITLFELNLGNNQLTGSIPSSLGNLSSLLYLQLNDNQLNGSIPSSLGNLTDLLELNLSRNDLTGAIPFQLGNLTSLEKLDLSFNFDLGSGTLTMAWLGNLVNLTYLDLDFCFPIFEFNFDIPIEIGNLTNLEHLGLLSFYFQPTPIPSWLENLTNLTYISLNIVYLTGDIPLWLGNRTNLQHLRIRSYTSQLTGTIPIELSNLTNLDYLYLSGGLTGEFPLWATTLTNLKVLVLSNNKLTGTIPIELGNLAQLTWLSLERNKLTGAIPSELRNLSNLESLYLNGNQLSGTLPSWIGDFANLQYLYLASNQFNGEFPLNYINLTNLIEIDTRFNALYSNDSSINDFINNHPCRPTRPDCADDWQTTQTTAPQNIQIVAASNNSISLNWDEVTYLQHGGYKINMATDATGPFSQVAETVGKMVTAHTQGGLTIGQNHYFTLKTFTNPHVNNQNTITSDASTSIFDTPIASIASADLYSIIGSSTILRKASGNTQTLFAEVGDTLLYNITVGNNGPDDALDAGFRHNLPTGLINGSWTCTVLTGTATCPTTSGVGNIDELLTLPNNSNLRFDFTAEVATTQEGTLLVTATITPPDGVNDGNLMTNVQFMNFTDGIFANSFE